jgi:pimeloyl-ACP methyl ester carboxylesterase
MKTRGGLYPVLAIVAAGALALVSAPYWISAFIFRPEPLPVSNPAAFSFSGAREVTFPSGPSDRLFAWWAPPRDWTSSVVLIVHGRSANISTRASIAARLRDDGFGVLLFDYRGYGRSSGRSTEQSLTADAEAAYDWLLQQGVGPGRIIVLGQSLGDAPAAQLSASRPVAGLALVSPFTSLPDAIADRTGVGIIRHLPWPRNRFEVADSLANLRAPVLFIVSRQDGLVPYANSDRASQHARVGRWLEADGLGHDGLLAAVARDGRLSRALGELVPQGRRPQGRGDRS